jgi:Tfp pilus assembly protein PilP
MAVPQMIAFTKLLLLMEKQGREPFSLYTSGDYFARQNGTSYQPMRQLSSDTLEIHPIEAALSLACLLLHTGTDGKL